MTSKKQPQPVTRDIALCYVRLSLTRDESDLNSPERQRANIQAECDRRGWKTEWYEDVEGHKSGTQEDNRPGWLALKARLGDPDVAAIVANDLSRLHRKGWRVGSLIDFIEQHNVGLVLAAPGRNLDLSGAGGKISTMIMALMDEYYATDTSQKQKDSVQYRHTKGVIVGRIPFGTIRKENSLLAPSPDGVWLLPDGTFVEGQQNQSTPPEAIWRGFADAVHRCMELFLENRHGRRKLADMLNAEGYRFRNVDGQIALFDPDDIRRIVSNWVEYGGGIIKNKRQNRRARDVTPANATLNPARAVFDVDFCYDVGRIIQERTRDHKRTPDNAVHLDATAYPLSKLIFCAHCEQLAIESDNAAARSHLRGKTGNNVVARRYRHDTERKCPAHTRSVKADLLERDFLLLIESLSINPDSLPLLLQALDHFNSQNRTEDHKAAVQAEIAHWRQRTKNADLMFSKARMSEEDWLYTHAEADTEIARLQTDIVEQREAEVALKLTTEIVANLANNWKDANGEMRRSLAHSLFDYIIYDLDTQRIVNFKLKPWVQLLMQLKITLSRDAPENEKPSNTDERKRVLWCGWRGFRTKQHSCHRSRMRSALSSTGSTAATKVHGRPVKSTSAMPRFIGVIKREKIA